MILNKDDVVLISNRRMFAQDEARFFVGNVVDCDRDLLKADGFSFVRDPGSGEIIRKPEKRVRILSIASPGHIVYQLATGTAVDSLEIESRDGDAWLVDGRQRLMNLSERVHSGHF